MTQFDGRHALITGAGRGIGAAIAARLAADGAAVTLLGRSASSLEKTATDLGLDPNICTAVADVTQREQVESAVAGAVDQQGPVDILINNAGQADSAPFHRTGDELWHRLMAVNLTGVYHCIQAVLPGMRKRPFGRVVNVASTAGLKGYAYVAAYCAAKHGVIGLTRALALELAPAGITVNAVCPGYTDTDIVAEAIDKISKQTKRSREAALAELVATNPQGRLVEPEEVADTVAWLCGARAAAVTGQSIAIAGGEVM